MKARGQNKKFWFGVILSVLCFSMTIFNFSTGWWFGGIITVVCLIINIFCAITNYRRL
jgi:uncharacterized membrane protein